MIRPVYLAVFVIAGLATGACSQQDETGTSGPAVKTSVPQEAKLMDGAAKTIGKVMLREDPTGTTVTLDIDELGLGKHGLHLHETGDCTLPDFESAGAHLNPDGKQHGRDNPQGPHLGDLANVTVRDDGSAHTDFLIAGVSISQLIDADGMSVVVHAEPDDYRSDPSGSTGPRIACAAFN